MRHDSKDISKLLDYKLLKEKFKTEKALDIMESMR